MFHKIIRILKILKSEEILNALSILHAQLYYSAVILLYLVRIVSQSVNKTFAYFYLDIEWEIVCFLNIQWTAVYYYLSIEKEISIKFFKWKLVSWVKLEHHILFIERRNQQCFLQISFEKQEQVIHLINTLALKLTFIRFLQHIEELMKSFHGK